MDNGRRQVTAADSLQMMIYRGLTVDDDLEDGRREQEADLPLCPREEEGRVPDEDRARDLV